jgi:hypothetical protein
MGNKEDKEGKGGKAAIMVTAVLRTLGTRVGKCIQKDGNDDGSNNKNIEDEGDINSDSNNYDNN